MPISFDVIDFLLETTEKQNLPIGEFSLSETQNGNKSLENAENFWNYNGKSSLESDIMNYNDLEESLRRINACETNTIYHRLETNPRAENKESVLFNWKIRKLSDNFSASDNYVNFR